MHVKLDRISKQYAGRSVLSAVSLEIPEKEMFALLGPSGSGKSTLLGIIGGLIRPDEGKLEFGDRVANDPAIRLAPAARSVGMVFQDLALWPHMTVEKHLRFVAPRTDPAEVLNALEITHLRRSRPAMLSGGEAQRLGIARALVTRPKVFLLDEPLGPLDRRLKVKMLDLILDMHRRFETTSILVTHDYAEAFRIASRVGILVDGRLIQIGKPADIYRHPISTHAAELSGPVSFLRADPGDGHEVTSRLGRHAVASDCAPGSRIVLRPQEVGLEEDELGEARILSCVGAPGRWELRVQVGEDILEARSKNRIEAGASVRVGLPDEVWTVTE